MDGFADRRIRNLFVLSLALVVLCTTNAHSIGDSIGKSVDELIDESNGIYRNSNQLTPQESRMQWSKERGINFTMPSKLSGNGTSPGASRVSTQSGEGIQYQTASTTNAAQTTSSQADAGLQASSVAGNWSFRLRDSKNRDLALTLLQSGNAISGTGTINDGEDTQKVTASGMVQGDQLNLNASSSGNINLYQMVLSTNGNTASGKYRAFPTSGEPWIGLAEGMRSD
jgi:hypothetical protein